MPQFWPPNIGDWVPPLSLGTNVAQLDDANRGPTAFRRLGGAVHMRLSLSATGALSVGAVLCTVPVGMRPGQIECFAGRGGASGVQVLPVEVNAAGQVALIASIVSGDLIAVSGSWPTG